MNRKKTALEEFNGQDLTTWQSSRTKDGFRTRDFYVTKFPDTPPEISPLACKILNYLFEYHSRSVPNKQLAFKILRMCEKLHGIALKKNLPILKKPWKFWKLVCTKKLKKSFWGQEREEFVFFTNPN